MPTTRLPLAGNGERALGGRELAQAGWPDPAVAAGSGACGGGAIPDL
jgi:hypothetical protein